MHTTLRRKDPCDAGSRRASGRRPSAGPSSSPKKKYCGPAAGGGVFCPRGAWCVSCSTSSLALVVCRRSASFRSTLCELWWSSSARAIAIDNRSCRSHERSRRSRRRLADVASSRATWCRPLESIFERRAQKTVVCVVCEVDLVCLVSTQVDERECVFPQTPHDACHCG